MEKHKRLPGTWQAREKYMVLMKERKASKLSLMVALTGLVRIDRTGGAVCNVSY
jgi:hypothetical protein